MPDPSADGLSPRGLDFKWAAILIVLGAALVGMIVGALISRLVPERARTVTRFYHVLPRDHKFADSDDHNVAVSPDGRGFVYVANGQLFVRSLDDLEAAPITAVGEAPVDVFFSPDGQWVGYFSNTEQQLKKVAVAGGEPVAIAAIADPLGRPSWSAAGDILFSQAEVGILRVADSGGASTVLIPAPQATPLLDPQLLPDGRTVLFHMGSVAAGQVAVQAQEEDAPTVLFAGAHPRYVPSGHIVYESGGVLHAVAFDLDTRQPAAEPVSLVEGLSVGPAQYGLSASGSLAYRAAAAPLGERIVFVRNWAEELLTRVPPH